MHNIEKSAFRKGEYVGYAKGVWVIRRRATAMYGNVWIARHRDNPQMPTIYAHNLRDMSSALAQHEGE